MRYVREDPSLSVGACEGVLFPSISFDMVSRWDMKNDIKPYGAGSVVLLIFDTKLRTVCSLLATSTAGDSCLKGPRIHCFLNASECFVDIMCR